MLIPDKSMLTLTVFIHADKDRLFSIKRRLENGEQNLPPNFSHRLPFIVFFRSPVLHSFRVCVFMNFVKWGEEKNDTKKERLLFI